MVTKRELLEALSRVRDAGKTEVRVHMPGFRQVLTLDAERNLVYEVKLDLSARLVVFTVTDRNARHQTYYSIHTITHQQARYLNEWVRLEFWPELAADTETL